MTIAATRRLIIEVLEGCQLEPRARSLLQKALAESWQVAPIRSREPDNQGAKALTSVMLRVTSPHRSTSP